MGWLTSLSGLSLDNTVIGGSTPAAITGTTITANSGFTGNLTGNVTGNVTGNLTGDVTGNVAGELTGTINTATTATTQSASDNSTKVATTAYVSTAVANLVDSAPTALDTLNELAAALGDDANFSTTVTNSIATKLPLAGGTMTGDIELDDDVKVSFGDSRDLQIYHAHSDVAGVTRNKFDVTKGGIEFNISGDSQGFNVFFGSTHMVNVGTGGTAFYGLVSVDKLIQSNDHGIDLRTADKILPWDNGTPGNSDNVLALGSSSYRFSELHAAGIYGTLQTAAQTNITSVGTLSALTVSGTLQQQHLAVI